MSFLALMADNKVRMPSSGAGLTTFYEESKSRILVSPHAVLTLTVLVVIVTMILNTVL